MKLGKWGSYTLVAMGLSIASVSALDTLNPSFTVKDIMPAELNNVPGIGGVDLFANGDGVICAWGGSQNNDGRSTSKSNGEVWIIPNLASGTPGTPVRVATGLREPLGIKVIGQDFYVMEKPRLVKFTGSGSNWTKTTVWSLDTKWYNDNMWHHFSWGLVYKDSSFWFTTGMAYPPDENDPKERGALLKVAFDGSGYTQYARGMRNTDGIGLGPDNEIFINDNQGDWKPADLMYWIPTKTAPTNNGRFYGYRTTVNNACGTTPDNLAQDNCPSDPVYPPAVWLPYGNFTNSPTHPILLKSGPYAGQMIFGDVFHGDILRTFVEKVNGEYQGAAFTFMSQAIGKGGIQFGVQQFLYTPSGSLVAVGIGGGSGPLSGSNNWNWSGTIRGMALLTPTTTTPFDILAIRSMSDGFDIEFSQPAAAAAGVAANWTVKTTVYTPVHTYGGDLNNSDNNVNVGVTSASITDDGKHVHLKLASLSTKRMYAITAGSAVKSATGSALWTNVGYYTLNSVNNVTTVVSAPVASFANRIHASLHTGRVALDVPFAGAWNLEILRLDGSRAARASGSGPSRFESGALPPGLYVVAGRAEGSAFREKIQVQ
jgi:hypothetical protein